MSQSHHSGPARRLNTMETVSYLLAAVSAVCVVAALPKSLVAAVILSVLALSFLVIGLTSRSDPAERAE